MAPSSLRQVWFGWRSDPELPASPFTLSRGSLAPPQAPSLTRPPTWPRKQFCLSSRPLRRSEPPDGTGGPENTQDTGQQPCSAQRALLGTSGSSASAGPQFLSTSWVRSPLCSLLMFSALPLGEHERPHRRLSQWGELPARPLPPQTVPAFLNTDFVPGSLTQVLERLLQSRQTRSPPHGLFAGISRPFRLQIPPPHPLA